MSESPSPFDAAIGLPARAAALPEASESEVLHVVNATLSQYGPAGLYGIARQLGAEILRHASTLVPHVEMSPHPEVRAKMYAFLCALFDEMHERPTHAGSAHLFHQAAQASEWTARKMVCSLLFVARSVRQGLKRALMSLQM